MAELPKKVLVCQFETPVAVKKVCVAVVCSVDSASGVWSARLAPVQPHGLDPN